MNLKLLSLLALLCVIVNSHAVLARTRPDLGDKNSAVASIDPYFYLFNESIYKTRVKPAIRAFKIQNNPQPLMVLVKECIEKFDSVAKTLQLDFTSKKDFEEALKVLKLKQHKVLDEIETPIIMILCMPGDLGVNPKLEIGNSPLFPYLSNKSEHFFNFLSGGRGKSTRLGLGEGNDTIMTKKDIKDFRELFSKILLPDNGDELLKNDYNHLQSLLKICTDNPELTLVVSFL